MKLEILLNQTVLANAPLRFTWYGGPFDKLLFPLLKEKERTYVFFPLHPLPTLCIWNLLLFQLLRSWWYTAWKACKTYDVCEWVTCGINSDSASSAYWVSEGGLETRIEERTAHSGPVTLISDWWILSVPLKACWQFTPWSSWCLPGIDAYSGISPSVEYLFLVCIPLCRECDQRARLRSDDADWLSGDGHQNPPHQKLISSSLPPGSAEESNQHLLWFPSSSPRGSPCCQHHPWVITIVPWGYIGKLRMGPCQTGERVREMFLFASVASRELPHNRVQEIEEEKWRCSVSHHLPIHLKSTEAQAQGKQQLSRGIGGPAFFTAAWWRLFFSLVLF